MSIVVTEGSEQNKLKQLRHEIIMKFWWRVHEHEMAHFEIMMVYQ